MQALLSSRWHNCFWQPPAFAHTLPQSAINGVNNLIYMMMNRGIPLLINGYVDSLTGLVEICQRYCSTAGGLRVYRMDHYLPTDEYGTTFAYKRRGLAILTTLSLPFKVCRCTLTHNTGNPSSFK